MGLEWIINNFHADIIGVQIPSLAFIYILNRRKPCFLQKEI